MRVKCQQHRQDSNVTNTVGVGCRYVFITPFLYTSHVPWVVGLGVVWTTKDIYEEQFEHGSS